MSFWLREKEKSAFFGQTRRESVFVCFFSSRSNARTMNDKDVEKEPLQSIIQTCDKSRENKPTVSPWWRPALARIIRFVHWRLEKKERCVRGDVDRKSNPANPAEISKPRGVREKRIAGRDKKKRPIEKRTIWDMMRSFFPTRACAAFKACWGTLY